MRNGNNDTFHPTTLVAEAQEFSYVSPQARAIAEVKGYSLPGGRYPIRNVQDLKAAIRAYGRGKPADKEKIKAHIKRRAAALDRTNLIPENWKSRQARTASASDGYTVLPTIVRNTVAEAPDITQFKAYSQDARDKMAKSGEALADGSYPIATKADLANAVQAFGRASNKARAKRHIITRAKALNAVDLLPAAWGVRASATPDTAMHGVEQAVADYNRDSDHREQLSAIKAVAVYRRGVRTAPLTAAAYNRHDAGMDRLLQFLDVLQSRDPVFEFSDSDLLPSWHPLSEYWTSADVDPVVASVAARRAEIDPTWGLHVAVD